MKNTRHLILILAVVCVLGTIAGCSSKKETLADTLAKADRHFEAGDYDRAEIEYRRVIQKDMRP